MAAKAGGFGAHVVMAAVTELFLVRVALNAGAGQAFLKRATVFRRIKTIPLADGFVSPGSRASSCDLRA